MSQEDVIIKEIVLVMVLEFLIVIKIIINGMIMSEDSYLLVMNVGVIVIKIILFDKR
jgi:hypothetical protein